MQKTIVVIDGLDREALKIFTDEIEEQGHIVQIAYISRDLFSSSYEPLYETHVSDYAAIMRRNGISTHETVLQKEDPSSANVFSVLADEILSTYPNISFTNIDRVVYSKLDTSWSELEFCLVFFGHTQWEEYVTAL